MLFNYELTLMTPGSLSEADSKAVVEKVKKLLPKEAKITKEDDWGLKDLAYHVSKNSQARLVQIQFVSESGPIKELNKFLNIEEGLVRYLLLKHNMVKDVKEIKPKAIAKTKK